MARQLVPAIPKHLMLEYHAGPPGFRVIQPDSPAELLQQLPDNIEAQAGMTVPAPPGFIAPVEFIKRLFHVPLAEATAGIANFIKIL